jgi:hypothetical protein
MTNGEARMTNETAMTNCGGAATGCDLGGFGVPSSIAVSSFIRHSSVAKVRPIYLL